MCVSYMRSLAQRKANALMQAMPAGAVIVDGELTIVECNRRFAEIMGSDILQVYEAKQSLQGARLDRVVSFHRLFAAILSTDQQVIDKQVRLKDRIVAVSVFPIEPGRLVGGVIQDITQPAVAKEQIVTKVREVSRRHLTMVQQIASLLGETAAESEVLLREIIDSFSLPVEDNQASAPSRSVKERHAGTNVY